jgi:hypothetical protein
MAANSTALSTPPDKRFQNIYLPTVQSCWDYGIARNAPLIPFIGSLLPYNFLRGVQFDTKIFKIAELVTALRRNIEGTLFDLNSRNEIKLYELETKELDFMQKLFNIAASAQPRLKMTGEGKIVRELPNPQQISEDQKEAVLAASGVNISIALDADSDLSTRIKNTWSGGEDILTQAIQGAATVAMNLGEVGRTIGQAMKTADVAGVPYSPMRYKGSEYGDITINFTLFTKNNYIEDIYYPLLFLRAISMPRKSEWEATNLLTAPLQRVISSLKEENRKKIEEAMQSVGLNGGTAQQIASFINERFRIVKPPPLFRVEHSSGLVFMNKAAITEFSYKAEGPWVRYHYDGLFGKLFSFNPNIGQALDRLIQDVYVKFPNAVDSCFPTRVKCTMVLKETDFITQDSYRDRESKKIFSQLKVAFDNLGATGVNTTALVAGGIAQNLDILVPDIKGAGDLLSGGKWVPPGESMSGIPGFL